MTTRWLRVRARLRRGVGMLARRVTRRFGFELSRPITDGGPAATPAEEAISLPPGREEPFLACGYEVIPAGRFDVVARNYYSPVPNLELLPQDIWDRRSALGGIDLGVERAMSLVEDELAPWIAELDVPADGPMPAGQFFLRNENYESADAELLYAMLRARKPGRIVELGSGFTTLLIGSACRRNAEDGVTTEHIAYDPYLRAKILGDSPAPPTRFEATSATDIPLSVFLQLQAGDILFVDTTHTVKLGSDVNYILLDVLPILAPGVIVHFHDIFLPWEYPRTWFEDLHYYWAEQYLLQAFLAFNDAFEVLLPVQAMAREHPDRLGRLIPSFGPEVSPGAFWLIRKQMQKDGC